MLVARRPRLRFGLALTAATLLSLRIVAGCEPGAPAAPIGARNAVGEPVYDLDGGVDGACVQIAPPDGAALRVTGTVVEAMSPDASGEPKVIPNAMISVEYGGIYLNWCDLGSASPHYVFGALSDDAGRFEIDVKEGVLGFHSFANDYLYGRALLNTADGKTVSMKMEPLPPGQAQPTIGGAGFDRTTVGPGEPVTYSAILKTWDPKDPLSDESVLVEATRSWSLELNPPAVGKKDDFSDGLWQRTFPAPAAPGTYTYWFSATTSTCITSQVVSSTLTVR